MAVPDNLLIRMKQGDTAPLPIVTLKGADLNAQDLTDCTVAFNVRKGATVIVDHGPCIVIDAALGKVQYDDWQNVDSAVFLAMLGDHQCEFEVTFATGKTLTFPNDKDVNKSYITLRVAEQIA